MAKVTKRKPSLKPNEEKKSKRARVEKPKPEYLPEQRNLQDLWRQTFPVGTEWELFDEIYNKYNWSFTNLEAAFEEGGELYGTKRVYLFGATEPQLLRSQNIFVTIPVVVAVVSPIPPSDKVGIKSVQRVTEEIVPMKQMKMDWVPYIPLEKRDSVVERLEPPRIFILSCTQRRAALRHLKIERLKRFVYCLPYFYNPFKEDKDDQETRTVVHIMFPRDDNTPLVRQFDWEFDEIQEFADDLIEQDELSLDERVDFINYVEGEVNEAKRVNREARKARKKAIENMSEETKSAFEQIRFIKFYPVPSPDTPDVSTEKSNFINRYYRMADIVL